MNQKEKKKMLDLIDRFWINLLNDYGEVLHKDLEYYGESLAEAIKARKNFDIELYQKMIRQTKGILDDLADENFDIRTLLSLMYEKYPPPKGEEET